MIWLNNNIKRAGIAITVLFVVFWSARIWSINQVEDTTQIYEMNQIIDCGDITICAKDSFLITQEEFETRFDLDEGIVDYSYDALIVGVCLEITNVSNSAITLDEIKDFISMGFEARAWASWFHTPYFCATNTFSTNSLAPGASQVFWFQTVVNRMSFKENTWNSINDEQFYYVLSLSPYKVKIRLIT